MTNKVSRQDRVTGCFFGQLAGDAFGSQVEFLPAAAVRKLFPDGLTEIHGSQVWKTAAGQPTDDGELALALARTLVERATEPSFTAAVANAYIEWYLSAPFDCGSTIAEALRAMAVSRRANVLPTHLFLQKNWASEANGALMRISPWALWALRFPDRELAIRKVGTFARVDTRFTHPNTVCQDTSALFAATLVATIIGDLDPHGAYGFALDYCSQWQLSPKVKAALESAKTGNFDVSKNIGHVLLALPIAFHAVLTNASPGEAVQGAVNWGGDTDTNGAITGALAGALFGEESFPAQWRAAVSTCDPGAGEHPRPSVYHPNDYKDLACHLAGIEQSPV